MPLGPLRRAWKALRDSPGCDLLLGGWRECRLIVLRDGAPPLSQRVGVKRNFPLGYINPRISANALAEPHLAGFERLKAFSTFS
jgi:hypothetical protein